MALTWEKVLQRIVGFLCLRLSLSLSPRLPLPFSLPPTFFSFAFPQLFFLNYLEKFFLNYLGKNPKWAFFFFSLKGTDSLLTCNFFLKVVWLGWIRGWQVLLWWVILLLKEDDKSWLDLVEPLDLFHWRPICYYYVLRYFWALTIWRESLWKLSCFKYTLTAGHILLLIRWLA